MVRLLLATRADPDYPSSDTSTATDLAAQDGRHRVIPLLIEAGASPDGSTISRAAPLLRAMMHRQRLCAVALLRSGANPATAFNYPSAAQRNAALRQLTEAHTRGMVGTDLTDVTTCMHRMLIVAHAFTARSWDWPALKKSPEPAAGIGADEFEADTVGVKVEAWPRASVTTNVLRYPRPNDRRAVIAQAVFRWVGIGWWGSCHSVIVWSIHAFLAPFPMWTLRFDYSQWSLFTMVRQYFCFAVRLVYDLLW